VEIDKERKTAREGEIEKERTRESKKEADRD